MYFIFLAAFIIFHSLGCTYKGYQHYEDGVKYAEAGDYDAAEAELKEAIQLMPEEVKLYAVLGNVYLKQGKYELASESYKGYWRMGKNILGKILMQVRTELKTFTGM